MWLSVATFASACSTTSISTGWGTNVLGRNYITTLCPISGDALEEPHEREPSHHGRGDSVAGIPGSPDHPTSLVAALGDRPSATRSGGRCHPPKLDAGDVDSGRDPTVDRRSRLACLLLGLEQDNREALAFGGL